MGLVTALLVLGSALAHAMWNAILKGTRDPRAAVTGVLVVGSLTSLVIGLGFRGPLPPPASIAWCLASGLLEAFYFVTLARALSRAPLGAVYTTVRGGGLAIVWPISIALFHEHVSLWAGGGTLLVVAGLFFTGFGEMPRGTGSEEPLVKRLGWAAVTACFVGGYQLAYKLALVEGGTPTGVVAISLVSACGATFLTLGRVRARAALEAIKAEPIRIGIAGVLTSVGFAIFLVAMGRAGAGAVATLRNTSILFAQAIAFGMGEKPKRLGVAGALLVTLGGVLLTQ